MTEDRPAEDVTNLLRAWSAGDAEALERLIPIVYQELRTLARHFMRAENPGHTLTPTALVHESLMKLMRPEGAASGASWQDRKHFFLVAARAMRQLLVDHARRKKAGKRDPANQVPGAGLDAIQMPPWDVIDLDRALTKLHAEAPRRARMLELRYFAGMDMREIAEVIEVSPATVFRELRVTEAWLAREVRGAAAAAGVQA